MSDPKALLLARVALEHANLWLQLTGLSEATLGGEPVAGEWTAKEVLAHVAAWDENHASRVAAILGGRAQRIVRPNRDVLNAQMQVEHQTWTLEHVVRTAQVARARFLALIESLSWDDITREHATASGESYSILFLTRRRAEHDAVHAADIQAWRTGRPSEPGPQSLLAAALDASRPALLAWRKLIPEEEWSTRPVCGGWTWQDLIGHIADWEQWGVAGLRDILAGQTGGAGYDPDWDRWNAEHIEARRGEPVGKTWNDLLQTRWDLLELLEEFDDDRLAEPVPSNAPDLVRFYDWFSIWAQHDCEHARTVGDLILAQDAPA
jgi:hypothetical protein